MKAWTAEPKLLKADANAHYTEVIEIDLNEIKRQFLRVQMTLMM